MSKLAIVYFSETNNTKAAAEYVATKVDAKLVRVQAKKNTNPMKAMLKLASKPVGEPWREITDCDQVLLMAPIYAFNGIPEIRAFLTNADLSGKEVMVVTSGADPDGKFASKVAAQYKKLIEASNGKMGPNIYHKGGDYKQFAGNEAIEKQVDDVLDPILDWVNQ